MNSHRFHKKLFLSCCSYRPHMDSSWSRAHRRWLQRCVPPSVHPADTHVDGLIGVACAWTFR
jgi:hypothetical protein